MPSSNTKIKRPRGEGVGCDPNLVTVLLCCLGTQSRAGLISALGKESIK